MQIRKFYAVNFPAALRDVRKTLGPEAVILATRSLSDKDARMLVNVKNARVEITAAVETPAKTRKTWESANALSASKKQPHPPRVAVPAQKILAQYADSAEKTPTLGNGHRNGKIPKAMRDVLRELRELSVELAESPRPSRPLDHFPTAKPWSPAPVLASRPLASADHPIFSPSNGHSTKWPTLSHAAPSVEEDDGFPASQWSECLREQGVEEALIQRILGRARGTARRTQTPADPLDPAAFEHFIRTVGDFVARPAASESASSPRPRRIALAGPTGVGKTTTIAKIAARHAIQKNERVALITLDIYRIAAAEQLKTYARLLGVPVEIVAEPDRLGEALERFRHADLVLIDTPGCSPGDQAAILRLSAVLARHPVVETHLVIPAALRLAEMRRAMQAFRPLRFERTIFSKLDEAIARGDLLNAWILDGLDVSYFTVGQRVPEDLEPASLEWLCRAMLPLQPAASR